jgi:hypothetical protein
MNDLRTLIRLIETAMEETQSFVHYSAKELPVGTVLTGQGRSWWTGEWARVLERYRPKGMMPLNQGVFMFDATDSRDHRDVGGADRKFGFEVKPLGPVQKHDARWAFDLDAALDSGDDDSIEVYAGNYWRGVASDEPMWEYITSRAEITDVYRV